MAKDRPVKVDTLKIEMLSDHTKLDLENAVNVLMEADGTRYSFVVIPFKGSLGCGYISNSNAYLVIDGGEKTAYAFTSPPAVSYVYEKLIRAYSNRELRDQGWGLRDAENTAKALEEAFKMIEHRIANPEPYKPKNVFIAE